MAIETFNLIQLQAKLAVRYLVSGCRNSTEPNFGRKPPRRSCVYRLVCISGILLLLQIGCAQYMFNKAVGRIQLERIDRLKVSGLDSSGVKLDMRLIFQNPTDIQAVLNRMEYEIYLEERYFGNGGQDGPFAFLPDTTFHMDLPIQTVYSDLASSIVSALSQDSVAYKINTKLWTSGQSRPYEATIGGKLPLTKNLHAMVSERMAQVGISVSHFEISAADSQKVRLTMDLVVHNPLPIRIMPQRIEYEVLTGEISLCKGYATQIPTIEGLKAKSIRTFQDFSLPRVSSVVRNAVTGRDPLVRARGYFSVQVLGKEYGIPFETPQVVIGSLTWQNLFEVLD